MADPEGPLQGKRNQIDAKRRRWGSRRHPPGKFLKNGCKWCILSPFFAEFVFIFSPKSVCNFAFKAPIFNIRIAGEFSPYIVAVEDHIKPKSGVFTLSQSGGGGGSRSPRENF